MDEPHAHSIRDEVDENGNKFTNNKAKD